MQYLLSQVEYDNLQSKAAAGRRAPKEQDLQKFCTLAANTMPAGVEWIGKNKPWGCILTKKGEWYCDDCPAKDICPFENKEWSK